MSKSPASPISNRHAGHAWFKEAVFYEVLVKSFFDSNGDGVGDFRGLSQKLDYIRDLGADCIWLLPFFPSPLSDDGYDVADYRGVHPALGTIGDWREFLAAAHDRGLRVCAEMVINHTSREHPWFQAARQAPAGSPLRDFYVWSVAPRPFVPASGSALVQGAGWSWDQPAQAFYWHRFSREQPDLNYDNAAVGDEMLKVLRFWAEMGIDGLCLNGVAFLAEQEGTKSEHLPRSHAILRRIRRELSKDYPGLVLQAGVNAWPSDAATYFGEGSECQLTPHLPLATRLFLAVKQESRRPLMEILNHTPPPPADCQWVTLLRNHDELTLSLATDEERDYLFQEYAADASMRLHGGIRRRLAPLVENNRSRIELLFSLLFALPGAPVIYYGDELGMGDNLFLGGRGAVRTPMQWNADKNGGFSDADFARLSLPPVMDPVYGHQAVNVATQQRDPSSLLHWVRRMIALRKRHPIFATGKIELLEPDNKKVLAFLRLPLAGQQEPSAAENEQILVVVNLSRSAQAVELDLSPLEGLVPVEMLGKSAFPRVGRRRYPLSLAPYGFYWFRLVPEPREVTRLAPVETEAVAQLPTIAGPQSTDGFLDGPTRDALARDVLPHFLRSQRWFGGKSRQIESVAIADWGRLPIEGFNAYQVLLRVRFAGGHEDTYSLPICVQTGAAAMRTLEEAPQLAIAKCDSGGNEYLICDALADDRFSTWLLAGIREHVQCPLERGKLQTEAMPALERVLRDAPPGLPVRRGPATSSNSLVFFGRRLLFKLFRRLERGTNPDYEIGKFLTGGGRFQRTPSVAGKLEYTSLDSDQPLTLGILQALVPNQGDGWGHALDELGRYFERASARMYAPDRVMPDDRPVHQLAAAAPPPAALETIAGYLQSARKLGRRTAQMHLALASDAADPDFAPEPLGEQERRGLTGEIEFQAQQAFTALQSQRERLPAEVAGAAELLLSEGADFVKKWIAADRPLPHATKTRIHGDYHLGQVLWVDSDYVILDFEGEPTRSVEERRRKFSPLRDVAGMLRSYHYAAYAGLFSFTEDRPADYERLEPWADLWHQWVSAAFLAEYSATAQGASFVPTDSDEFAYLLDAFMLAKALYELAYELNNRPDWVRIPLGGVMQLLDLTSAPSGA